jgi:hypothetical protein
MVMAGEAHTNHRCTPKRMAYYGQPLGWTRGSTDPTSYGLWSMVGFRGYWSRGGSSELIPPACEWHPSVIRRPAESNAAQENFRLGMFLSLLLNIVKCLQSAVSTHMPPSIPSSCHSS